MKYQIGDEVTLKVNVGSEKNPRWEGKKIQIIGLPSMTRDGQYLCYVPKYLFMPRLFKINQYHQKFYEFDNKFLGDQGTFITDDMSIYAYYPTPEGAVCNQCLTFIEWAETNEFNKFTCRKCRENPYR